MQQERRYLEVFLCASSAAPLRMEIHAKVFLGDSSQRSGFLNRFQSR
jgi:hypothetical protein